MIVVLDVSAAYALVLGGKAQAELRKYIKEAALVLAPTLYIAEATNMAWKYHRFKEVSFSDAKEMVELALQLIDEYVADELSWRHALVLACDNGHSVYDCMYLHLAKEHKATLLTLDKRLLKLAKELGISVGNLA
jgi:predicted nucleic acid-binding protein